MPDVHEEQEDDAPESDVLPPAVPFRLSEDQIEQITARLRAGKALPPYLLPHLFERPREYELSYAGKMRRADVLSETMALPLQAVKSFGLQNESWSNKLILGDNLQVLRTLLAMKEAGQLRNPDGSQGVRLCYIDPPFGTQRDFTGQRTEVAYEDRVAGAEFVEHLRRRLILIKELLTDDGAIYVHLDQKKVHYIKVVLDEIFGETNFQNEIIWKRTTSHSDAKRYGAIHDSILYYRNSSRTTFQAPLVPLDPDYVQQYYRYIDDDGRRFSSADLTANNPGPPRRFGSRGVIAPPPGRQWAYNQEGIDRLLDENRVFFTRNGIPRRKIFLDDVEGMPSPDLWNDVLPIVSYSQERTNYPTQKPTKLVERIISASSNPGDIILDCFSGSGTSAVAAETIESGKRRWIAIDCGKFAVHTAQARLLRLAEADDDIAFVTYNAGLYDYRALRELDWDEYRAFALRLFQCSDERQILGGFEFDGVLGDYPVLVYNFENHPDSKIGSSFIEDLSTIAGAHLGERCFIIAPALSVEPYEDYLDHDGTRYFFLRIPYSVIAELHKRAFSELRQPTSEEVANATIDAVGFDFVQPPVVEAIYERDDLQAFIRLTSFESQAFAADPSEDAISDLAMVMIDYDYDGRIFDLDAVLYAKELSHSDWTIAIPVTSIGSTVMLAYLDTFGNEHRETKTLEDFTMTKSRGKVTKRTPSRKAATDKRTTTGKKAVAKKAVAKKAVAKKAVAKKATSRRY